jgi:hypothetical protein
MRRIQAVIFLSFIVLSCKNPDSNPESIGEYVSTKKESKELVKSVQEAKPDTFVSSGNELVIFKPTRDEYDFLVSKGKSEKELYKMDSLSSFYSQELTKKYKGQNYKIHFPHQRIIKIVAFDGTHSFIDRLSNGTNEFGLILNSSKQEPRVEFGILTDEQILNIIGN